MKDPLLVQSPWRNRLLFFYFAALAMWFAFQFSDLAVRACNDRLVIAKDNNFVSTSDYLQFYIVNKIACSEDKGKLFQWPIQHKWENKITAGYPTPTIPFLAQNCPITFLLTFPFSFLPMNAGQMTWNILTLVFGAFGTVVLVRSGSKGKVLPLMIVLAVAASAPSVVMMIMGQLTWFLLGTVCLYFWSLLKGRDWLAGVCLAFTAVKYQFVPILLLALIPRRQFKALISMTAGILVLCTIIGTMWGWSNFVDYPKAVLSVDGGVPTDRAFTCIRGLLAICGVPTKFTLLIGCALVAPIGLILGFIGFTGKLSPRDLRLWFAMLMCLDLVFAPHSFADDSVMHGATAALFFTEYYHERVKGVRATIIAWMLLLAPLCSWFSVFASAIGMVESMTYVPFNLTLAALFYSLIAKERTEMTATGPSP